MLPEAPPYGTAASVAVPLDLGGPRDEPPLQPVPERWTSRATDRLLFRAERTGRSPVLGRIAFGAAAAGAVTALVVCGMLGGAMAGAELGAAIAGLIGGVVALSAAALLGLWGLIQGIVAIATRRGAGWGKAALVTCAVGLVVAPILFATTALA